MIKFRRKRNLAVCSFRNFRVKKGKFTVKNNLKTNIVLVSQC